MICIIALVVFAVLGIFSAKYRTYAKEAFNCVFKRITLRKCDTAFNQRMKAKITGKLMKRSLKASKFVFKHFEIISWIFTIILFVSLAYSAYGLYNLTVHGTCDPNNPDQCILTLGEEPTSECEHIDCLGEECMTGSEDCKDNCSCVGEHCET